MAYRHECFCHRCKMWSGVASGAKRMSKKLKRMAAKLELRKIILIDL